MLKLDRFLPYRLSIASNAVSDRVAAVYQARFGLTVAAWRILAVVAEQTQATQASLAAATRMDRMTISRAATALVARGLLARAPAGDRRTLRLALTDEGASLYRAIAPLALETEASLLADFTQAERAVLMDLLVRLEACTKT